jgi:hypothetical protein
MVAHMHRGRHIAPPRGNTRGSHSVRIKLHNEDDQALLLRPARNAAGHWVKGQSGNFYGRSPAVRSVIALAREHTEDAVRVLAEILNDAACRIVAAGALLDRGWGRPLNAADAVAGDPEHAHMVNQVLAALAGVVIHRAPRDA